MAYKNVAVLKYNNYYNRIIKRLDDAGLYIGGDFPYSIYENVNFCHKDGIDAELVLNNSNLSNGPKVPSTNPYTPISVKEADYLIEYDGTSVLSRWFIIEADEMLTGQYRLILHRDVVADNYDDILEAPIYLEKATVKSINDPFVWNKEDIQFNEIKKEEILLKDKSNVPWIVGYFAENNSAVTATVEPNISLNYMTVADITQWQYYPYTTGYYKHLTKFGGNIEVTGLLNKWWASRVRYIFDLNSGNVLNGNGNAQLTAYPLDMNKTYSDSNGYLQFGNELVKSSVQSYIRTQFLTYYTNYHADVEDLLLLNGKYIKDLNTNKIYYIRVNSNGSMSDTEVPDRADTVSVNIGTYLGNNITMVTYDSGINHDFLNFELTSNLYSISLSEVVTTQYTVTIPSDTNKLQDAPYKMFAIPFGSVNSAITGVNSWYTADRLTALNIANAIAVQMGSNLYDLQILPYCPVQNIINANGACDLRALTNQDYTLVTTVGANPSNVTFVLYPQSSSFTFDIRLTNSSLTVPTTVLDTKIAVNCKKFRLNAPNYTSSFDFNIATVGNPKTYNIDCTYKPFSPYIHVNPIFGKLYGQDFNDCRGLVCQGDFSVPIVNDHWIQYQINNKNYLNAFNREVESLELQNRMARINDVVKAVTGTVTGTYAGAVAGGLSYGGIGAAVGASVGAAASLYGGIKDIEINDRLRMDALDLKHDMFNFNLQNIQALPRTLAKISSYDINNKYWPFIEVYSATDEEIEAFRNKLKYNGMTIMKISKISDYLTFGEKSYVKGQLIRLESINDDFHTFNVISDELNKGVFI